MATKKDMEEKKEIETKFFVLIGLIVFVALLGVFILFKTPTAVAPKKEESDDFKTFLPLISKNGIAIINIQGVIQFGQSSSFFGIHDYGADHIISKIRQYTKEDKVKGIVLRINSPGGTIGAVQEIYEAVLAFRKKGKKVVTSMGDIAASGGYYIAAASDKIVANPGTITGSIGVIIMSASFEKLFQKIGISYRVFKSGRYKDILSSYRAMAPDERAIIQSVVDDAYNQFYVAVKKGRKLSAAKVSQYGDGRIFTGRQGEKWGFIDQLGTLEDAIRLAGKITGLGEDPYIIREYYNPWQRIIGYMIQRKTLTEKIFELKDDNPVPVYYLYQP
ncbi:MAG: signal peptide peptidase SppA [Spirochaetes bacterium]|nr:signal peptide peptidase SppA [Spirochaetota bacterium]